ALFGCAWRLDPAFIGLAAQIELSTHIWELALLALPMTLIIITGGIDLSVGSAMALSAVALGMSFRAGAPPFAAAALALLAGAGCGALNGWFIASVRVHPLIVTLATLAAFRGMAEGVSEAAPISGFPDGFTGTLAGSVMGAPVPALLFLLFALAAALVLTKTPFGRSLYAIGHNETAARFSGLSVDRIKWRIYTLSGAMAGLAAILYVARRNTAKADIGANMELEVITAVVLGGASIFGGRGNIVGTLLGVLLIHETREFITWHWARNEWNAIVIGALLIASVLLHRLLSPKGREE
ncbi:MAG: ABC transporter permease, partial [Candidatus Sumerlaeota bacterium]|nr:ABC transporter permease [Candidatus Sumerlaeota bacterium]